MEIRRWHPFWRSSNVIPSPSGPRRSSPCAGSARIWAARSTLCQARGLQQRPGLRRQQDAQARVPDPRGHRGRLDTLVSIGGIQSNQTRQVAAVAAHLGMKCVLVQENWVNYSDAVYDRVGNIQMSRIMGADVRLVRRGLRYRHPQELGRRDGSVRPGRRQALPDSGRLFGCTP